MKGKLDNRGFTLVEMMVAIAVTAIASVAASTILVAGIRYSSIVYRQARITQELVAFDRMLELAADHAAGVAAYYRDDGGNVVSLEGEATNPGSLWIVFKRDDGKYQIFYFDSQKKICHSIADTEPEEGNLTALADHMTPLTEHCEEWTVTYNGSSREFIIEMKLTDGQVTEEMKNYWVLSEKAEAESV